MVEVDEDQNEGSGSARRHVDFEDKVPGEDEEPDMGDYGDEELVPVRAKGHGGLFGADLSSVKF